MFKSSELTNELSGLKKFAYKLTRNESDAEDLLHNTCVRALEKKHLFKEDSDLFKWSSRIMYNLFVSEYRRKTKFETQYDPETYLEKQSVDAAQDTRMEILQLEQAMDALSEEHREILVLVCVQGMEYAEVAKCLSIPVGTVRSRLSRARTNLQMALQTNGNLTHSYTPAHHHIPVARAA
ncbi:MAG: sigma-70 family RNA polymerase sigma factor [Pseudomonadota bacterium]